MEKLRSLSRSIINDPVQKRVSQLRYQNHLEALKKPYRQNSQTILKKSIHFEKS